MYIGTAIISQWQSLVISVAPFCVSCQYWFFFSNTKQN